MRIPRRRPPGDPANITSWGRRAPGPKKVPDLATIGLLAGTLGALLVATAPPWYVTAVSGLLVIATGAAALAALRATSSKTRSARTLLAAKLLLAASASTIAFLVPALVVQALS